MTKENLINLVDNKKPVELVQEIDNKYEIPSFEEFMKTYESDDSLNYDDLSGGGLGEVRGYGPGKKDSLKLWENERWISEENGDKKWFYRNSAEGKIGLGGPSLDINNSASYLKGNKGGEEYSLFGVSAESSFTIGRNGGLDVSTNLGLDLYKFKDKDKKLSIRPNVDTGISKEDGSLEVKAGGFGISVGKYTGLNTPLGELKINTEENCVVQ